HRLKLGVFARPVAEAFLVGDDFGVAQQAFEFLVPLHELVEFARQGCIHELRGWLAAGAAGVSLLASSSNRRSASWIRSLWPSALAFLSCTLGECSSLLVRRRASSRTTACGSSPLSRARI